LNDAAHASRLHAHGLCLEEFELFQYHIGRSDLESYLKVRNTMLWLWREKPDEPLTLIRAFEETKNFGLHHGLIAHVYEFLLRSGYINFGGCPFQDDEEAEKQREKANERLDPSTHRHTKSTDSSISRKTIVVIGSGIAGIGAAKQLENLFHYYAWKFAPELPPRVVVLEARSRVGGRMHSFELNTKPTLSSTLQARKAMHEHGEQSDQPTTSKAKRHCVDLGAQIITGFENGNPMDIIVRRQLQDLQLHFLVEETCDLFGHDGRLVPKAMDVHCETVFNDILEQACKLRDEEDIPKGLLVYLGDRVKMDGRGPGRVHSTDMPTLGHSMDYFIQTHPEFKSWSPQELGLIHWHYANLEVNDLFIGCAFLDVFVN
jgi:lysine-specific histone demethylase 1